MDWKDLAGPLVSVGAKLLGGLVAGPPGAVVGGMIADALGADATPEAVKAAIEADPSAAAARIAVLEADNKREFQKLILEAETAMLAQTDATYQKEIASSDGFVRRMRPTFGYVLALSVGLEVVVGSYTAIAAPANLPDLAQLYEALVVPQSVALAVLGVYVKKRSDEKILGAGRTLGPSLLTTLVGGTRGNASG